MASSSESAPLLPNSLRARLEAWLRGLLGYVLLAACLGASASLLTWSAADPSIIHTTDSATRNALGAGGANFSDLAMRLFGLAAVFIVLPPVFWALQLITRRNLEDARLKLILAPAAVLLLACVVSAMPRTAAWPLPNGLGGLLGDHTLRFLAGLAGSAAPERATVVAAVLCLAGGLMLLLASLGMSLRDLRLICRARRPRLGLFSRGWGGLVRAIDRGGDRAYRRREPTLDMTAEFEMRYPPFPPEPAFDTGPRLTRPGNGMQVPPSKRVNLRRPVRDPEFERSTENDSRAMAQRFAPARDEPAETSAFGLLRRRRRAASAPDRRAAERGPVWPGSMPAPPTDGSAAPEEHLPHARIEGDELYGRAVAIVRAQRKASAAYLQQSLGIGYMRAADLIDRMEREGIVGAPIHNGLRPILGPSAYARTV